MAEKKENQKVQILGRVFEVEFVPEGETGMTRVYVRGGDAYGSVSAVVPPDGLRRLEDGFGVAAQAAKERETKALEDAA